MRIPPSMRQKSRCSRREGGTGLEDRGLDFRSLTVLGNKIQVREVGVARVNVKVRRTKKVKKL